jgi:hypothetical protein
MAGVGQFSKWVDEVGVEEISQHTVVRSTGEGLIFHRGVTLSSTINIACLPFTMVTKTASTIFDISP